MSLTKTLFFLVNLIFFGIVRASFNEEEDNKLEQTNSFLTIPTELQVYISTFLDQKSFINFSNTHPSFKSASKLIRNQKKIELSGKKLNKEDCVILSQLPFSKFILSNCELEAEGIQVISLCQFITELNLSKNNVNEDAAQALANGNLDSLDTLDLERSMIRVRQITILGNGNLSSLRSIYLGNNYIRDEGVQALASSNLTSLTSLYLSDNRITHIGAQALASGNLCSLSKLYLTNNFIRNEGAQALASGNLYSLVTLYLVSNEIEFEGAQALALSNLSSLSKLYLSMKPIRPYLNTLKALNSKLSIIGVDGIGAVKD